MRRGSPDSPRTSFGRNYVSRSFDDLPERAAGAVVVDAASVVRTLFLQHFETDEPTELFCHVSLQDHFTWRLGLVETWLVMPDYPDCQREPATPAEEQLSHLVPIQRRVPDPDQ
jgi:hypothetical protein